MSLWRAVRALAGAEMKTNLIWGTNMEHPETGPEWLLPEEVHSGLASTEPLRSTLQCCEEMARQRDELLDALKACDEAFASWQIGQIPGRPEDILALIVRVRSAIALSSRPGPQK